MQTVRTKADILELSFKIESAGVKIPENVKILIELPEEDYDNLIKQSFEEMSHTNCFEYHATIGIKFKIKRHR